MAQHFGIIANGLNEQKIDMLAASLDGQGLSPSDGRVGSVENSYPSFRGGDVFDPCIHGLFELRGCVRGYVEMVYERV